MAADPLLQNVLGVSDLIKNKTNKTSGDGISELEGIEGDPIDALSLDMTDEELLKLRDDWEKKYAPYETAMKMRWEENKKSYLGTRAMGAYIMQADTPIAGNYQFVAEETFLAAALASNPEPVVIADNTPEGNAIATAVKTMLAFHFSELVVRRKLGVMVRQWSVYHLGVIKPGWDLRINDVTVDNRKIQDFVFDPEGYVDAYGDFTSYLGERITVTADKLIELFPEHEDYILEEAKDSKGARLTYTEWWTDEFCFTTLKERVLDKHKNQYFKYPEPVTDVDGNPIMADFAGESQMTDPRNHFAYPKKPYIFLSVFSLQEQPHDITGLIEQNIETQSRIARREDQIDANVSVSNNSVAFSQENFNQETAKQAAGARRKGNPILIPEGGPAQNAIIPLPAVDLPNGMFAALENDKNNLMTSWGVQGITSQPQEEDQTARGMILEQQHDTSRIGGGIGSSVEQVANNLANWLVQLYTVFYDEQHFAAVMGNAKAVEFVTLSAQQIDRQLIVSVAPDSMRPKDDITTMNLAQNLFDKGAIGPKTLLKMVDFPDPDESAADGVMYRIDPMGYFQLNFPEYAARLQQQQQQNAAIEMANQAKGAAMMNEAVPPEGVTEPQKEGLSMEPASAGLDQVQLPPIQ